MQASLHSLREELGGAGATRAAALLLDACARCGVRAEVEINSLACVRDPKTYNEQDAQQVIPGLWVGPLGPADSVEWLHSHGITHVLDATGGWRRRVSALESGWEKVTPTAVSAGLHCLVIEAEDRTSFDLARHFGRAVEFVGEALRRPGKTAVLVHCHSGVSRSATLAMAYLLMVHGLTVREALRVLRDARPAANPNSGFEQQLVRHEMRLRTAARAAAATGGASTSASTRAVDHKRQREESTAADDPTAAGARPAPEQPPTLEEVTPAGSQPTLTPPCQQSG